MTRSQQRAQGDLLILPLSEARRLGVRLGTTRQPLAPDPNLPDRVVLAYGEATGHHHTLPARAVAVAERDELGLTYLTIEELTEVEHNGEHLPITLDPIGEPWLVIPQVEGSPWGVRPVAD